MIKFGALRCIIYDPEHKNVLHRASTEHEEIKVAKKTQNMLYYKKTGNNLQRGIDMQGMLMFGMMLGIALCMNVSAYAFEAIGSCGEHITYTFDASTGKLVFTGTGPMF